MCAIISKQHLYIGFADEISHHWWKIWYVISSAVVWTFDFLLPSAMRLDLIVVSFAILVLFQMYHFHDLVDSRHQSCLNCCLYFQGNYNVSISLFASYIWPCAINIQPHIHITGLVLVWSVLLECLLSLHSCGKLRLLLTCSAAATAVSKFAC